MAHTRNPNPAPTGSEYASGRAIAVPLALGASIALHAGLGITIGVRAANDSGTPSQDRFAMSDFAVPEDALDPRFVALGNPDSRSASLTWIGYDEFEEMWAPQSEVDQALQNPEDPGSPTEPDRSVLEPSEESAALTEPDTPTPTEENQPEPDPQEQFLTPEIAPTVESPSADAPEDYSDLLELVDAIEDLTADIPRFNPIETLRELRSERASRREAVRAAAPEAEQPSNPPDPASEVAEKPDTAKSPNSGQSGQKAQREADSAAVNPVRNADLGKPLAAQGLSIRTVRPSFSNVTLATARPRNPIARIDFRRNGKPIRVSLIQSSGHEQVDIEIRKALYAWRASGEALLQLPEAEDPESPAFVSIKLEILL